MLESYKPICKTTIEDGVDTTSAHLRGIPIFNTVFASSRQKIKIAITYPLRIQGSLESLERNYILQKKGLG